MVVVGALKCWRTLLWGNRFLKRDRHSATFINKICARFHWQEAIEGRVG